MKSRNIFLSLLLAAGMVGCHSDKPKPQETAKDLPGENLDLYAVMDLFRHAKSVKGFEEALNDKSKKVNNLDLNQDGKVDYIRVTDHVEGKDHTLVLQTPVSDKESQDVAVIEIHRTGDKSAELQIIGDTALYGKNYIIEPKPDSSDAGTAFMKTIASPAEKMMLAAVISFNVWYWEPVQYIYAPDYVVYVSPYHWAYYPPAWDPWEPVAYEVYYPVVYTYHTDYVFAPEPRFVYVHEHYYNNWHSYSPYVHEHYHPYNGPRRDPNAYYGPRRSDGNSNGPRENARSTDANRVRDARNAPDNRGNNGMRGNGGERMPGMRNNAPAREARRNANGGQPDNRVAPAAHNNERHNPDYNAARRGQNAQPGNVNKQHDNNQRGTAPQQRQHQPQQAAPVRNTPHDAGSFRSEKQRNIPQVSPQRGGHQPNASPGRAPGGAIRPATRGAAPASPNRGGGQHGGRR